MSETVSIDFPKEDVNAIFRQIDRAQTDLGKSLYSSTRWAGWFVSKSLAAATKLPSKNVVKSGKRRVIREVKAEGPRKRGSLKTFEATRYTRGGGAKTFQVKAKSKSEANKLNILKINYWGLAKSSWMWAIKPLGSGSKFGFATSKAKEKARRSVVINTIKDKFNPSITIRNRLPYIVDAINGGDGEVVSVMGKASRNMSRSIDDALKKKMGAK